MASEGDCLAVIIGARDLEFSRCWHSLCTSLREKKYRAGSQRRRSRIAPRTVDGSTRSPRWVTTRLPRFDRKIAAARVRPNQAPQRSGCPASSAIRRATSEGHIVLPAPRSASSSTITCSIAVDVGATCTLEHKQSSRSYPSTTVRCGHQLV